MTDTADYFRVLGVSETADDAAIRNAFRALAKDLHPDRHAADAVASQRFKTVTEAYEVLKDGVRRRAYLERRALAARSAARRVELRHMIGFAALACAVVVPVVAVVWLAVVPADTLEMNGFLKSVRSRLLPAPAVVVATQEPATASDPLAAAEAAARAAQGSASEAAARAALVQAVAAAPEAALRAYLAAGSAEGLEAAAAQERLSTLMLNRLQGADKH